MPVRKFRSIEEMTPPPARAGDPQNLLRALAVSRACLALDPRRPPAGVYKFRSVDDAYAARLAWERSKDK